MTPEQLERAKESMRARGMTDEQIEERLQRVGAGQPAESSVDLAGFPVVKLIDFSTRRPVSVTIFAVAAVVFGLVAFSQLATDLLPDINYPSLTVQTTYEGTAPIEVESLITRPVENAVGVVNNVVRVISSSRTDVSEVTLEFSWDTNMDMAALDVRERLDVLQLPVEADRPILLRFDPSLDPILRLGLFGEEDLIRLRLIAEEQVQRSLERIEGVAAVVVSGGLEEEIQVEIDERKLANLGISVDRVVDRLAQENINLTGGRLREGQSEFLVRTVNEFLRPEDLEQVVIDSSGGAVVRVEDVARVYKGHKEREVITRINGQESVEVAVYKEGGTNTVKVSDAVQANLDDLGARLKKVDPALELDVVTDQARYIRQSVTEVLRTALYGGALAIMVLFFFLRSWKTTLIIGLAIPISVVSTFFLMFRLRDLPEHHVAGRSDAGDRAAGGQRHRRLGVDSAPARQGLGRDRGRSGRHQRRGQGRHRQYVDHDLCLRAHRLCGRCAGQLFGDQAMTVTFSLVVSLLVALTIIPMLASRGARDSGTRNTKGGRVFEVIVWIARGPKAVAMAVAKVLGWILAGPLKLFEMGYDALARLYSHTLAWVLAACLDHRGHRLCAAGRQLDADPGTGPRADPRAHPG